MLGKTQAVRPLSDSQDFTPQQLDCLNSPQSRGTQVADDCCIWHRDARCSGCLERKREREEEEESIPCRVDMAASMEVIQKMTGYPSESSGYLLSAAEVAK